MLDEFIYCIDKNNRIISRSLYNISDLRVGELLKNPMSVPDSVSEVYSWSPGCGFSTADGKEIGGFCTKWSVK